MRVLCSPPALSCGAFRQAPRRLRAHQASSSCAQQLPPGHACCPTSSAAAAPRSRAAAHAVACGSCSLLATCGFRSVQSRSLESGPQPRLRSLEGQPLIERLGNSRILKKKRRYLRGWPLFFETFHVRVPTRDHFSICEYRRRFKGRLIYSYQ